MPGPWNDGKDRQLLLIMMHLAPPQQHKWDQVASLMGDGFTSDGVRQHCQKLRKQSAATFGPPGDTPVGTPAKGTPRKQATGDKSQTSARKRKSHVEVDSDEDGFPIKKQATDEEGDGGTPSKKAAGERLLTSAGKRQAYFETDSDEYDISIKKEGTNSRKDGL